MNSESATDSAPALYFYHPDHLGSTAMVTNEDGHFTECGVYSVRRGVCGRAQWQLGFVLPLQRQGTRRGNRVVLLWGEVP